MNQRTKGFAILGLAALFCLVIAPAARADEQQVYNWKNARIVGAKVTGVVFHPTAKDVCYARTATSGAYRWDAASKSWVCITDWVGSEDWNYDGIESIALDPNDPDRIFMAVGTYTNDWAGKGAMLRSPDRGVTWEVAPTPFKMGGDEAGNGDGERLAVDPNNGKILFFGSRNNGLWRSSDLGETWTQIEGLPVDKQADGVGVTFVTFQQQSGLKAGKPTPVIYACVATTNGGLYRSKDGGASWEAVANQPTGVIAHRAVWDSNRYLFITYGNAPGSTDNTSGSVWRFDPASDAWTDLTPRKPGASDPFGFGGLALDGAHPETIMVATLNRTSGDDLFRTVDGGKTWQPIVATSQRDSSLAPWLTDGHSQAPLGPAAVAIAIDPNNSDRVWCTSPWGLWLCDDAKNLDLAQPTHWTVGSLGIEGVEISRVLSPAMGAQILSGGRRVDGFRHESVDNSPALGVFEPEHSGSSDLEIAGGNPNFVVRFYGGEKKSGAAYSLDNGVTWNEFPSRPKKTSDGMIAVSADGGTFIWSPPDGKSQRSRDHGATWVACKGLPPGAIAVADCVDAHSFYAFDPQTQGVFVSTDSGGHFAAAAEGITVSTAVLATVPGHAGHLWLATDKGLLRSTDAGDTFTPLALVQQAYMISFGKSAPDQSYPAVYIWGRINEVEGIFRSVDEGANWVRINDDRHKFGAITSISGDPRIYGRIYIGSINRGVIYGDPAPLPPPKIKNDNP